MSDYTDALARHHASRVQGIAASLRRMAETVERQAEPSMLLRDTLPTLAHPTHRILHEITWGLANLNLDGLAEGAAEYDAAIRVEALRAPEPIGQPFTVGGWDGLNPPDYVCPVEVGARYRFTRDGTTIDSTVVRHEGYAPDVVELEHNTRIDLVGWTVQRLPEVTS